MSQCRFCQSELIHSFADLGMSPNANAYVKPDHLSKMEPFYPLHAFVCDKCFLVQLEEFQTAEEIFSDYAYFSSYSESWLKHCKSYVEQMIDQFRFNADHLVMEIASNDGYLLQYFKERGVPVFGVEPAGNVAKVANDKGVTTIAKFFGTETAQELANQGKTADLLLGNNVLAHVPDLNDFVKGMKIVLKSKGIITMEFPHLMRLMEDNQFDTIYHEHFSYFSFMTVEKVFAKHGLTIFDVEQLPTHGGSLRIYGRHTEDNSKPVTDRVTTLKQKESDLKYDKIETYIHFAEQVRETKRKLLDFLIRVKRDNKTIVGYGAPAKGNTLLNYCGVRTDFLDYTVDKSPHKHGSYLPGTHIPIYHPDKIRETKPDYVLILPWNIKAEIMDQMSDVKEWGGKFVVPIPEVTIL